MKKAILLLTLVLVVFFSGCNGQETTDELQYKNDIITIEEYFVSDKNPYEGSIVMIELVLKNNGEEPVPWMKVEFNAAGFEIDKDGLSCEGTKGEVVISGDKGHCIFEGANEIESLENSGERRVLLALKVPNRPLLHPYPLLLSYSIDYKYSGFRKMDIPIIDGKTLTRPLSKYSQSTPTYGPILLTFGAPERGERVENGQTIKEYWGVADNPFTVKMKFTHVGSRSIGEITEPKIGPGMVKLDLRGSLKIATVGEEELPLPCDFCEGGEDECKDKKGGYLFSKEEVEISDKLSCNFQSTVLTEPETRATIWAEFNYTYSYTKFQEFEIQPL